MMSPRKYARHATVVIQSNGFTLIELLLAIGIIAVLAAIVIIAVNPSKQLGDAKNRERAHNDRQFEKAMYQYLIDFEEFPGDKNIPDGEANALQICRYAKVNAGCINVDEIAPDYLSCIPYDDTETNADYSGYELYQIAGRAQVEAVYAGSGAAGGGCTAPPVPIAYWKLDENSIGATVRDAIGDNDGTMVNIAAPEGPSTQVPNVAFSNHRSLRLLGDDYVDVTDFDVIGDQITITAWFYWEGGGNDPRFISKATGVNVSQHWWMLGIDDPDDLRFRLHAGGSALSVHRGTIAQNTWTHAAGVYDGTQMCLYLNGVLQGSCASKTGDIRTGVAPIQIGDNAGDTRPFNGLLDEIRVYDQALTADEIATLARGNP